MRIRPPQVWTAARRPTVLALTTALLAGVAVACWRQPAVVPDPPGDGPRAAELATRLDPNVADAAALSALPGLGAARARALVAYRADFARRHPGRSAFTSPRDLLPVKGIGTSTAGNLEPYLTFPAPDR